MAESIATVIGTGLKHYWTLGALVLLIALGLGYGGFRLASPQTNDGPTVAMIASDKFEGVPPNWEEIWAHYVPAIEAAAAQGATVIVLPEKMFEIDSSDVPELLDDAQELARKYDASIIFGADERDEGAWNRAYLVSGESEPFTYDKRHMIPGAESHFSLGSRSVIADAGSFSSGIAICKALDFPSTIREYGKGGAAALLVPAWDFNEDAWFHPRIAVMRGVENGTSMVRSARRGFLTLSDPYGRIRAEAPSGPEINRPRGTPDDGVQILVSQVPNSHQVLTVYTRVGETFGWIALAYGSGALVAAGLTARRQRAASAD